MDEKSMGSCFQLVFAPIDELFPDDAPLVSSGFRVIPLDIKTVEYFLLVCMFGIKFVPIPCLFLPPQRIKFLHVCYLNLTQTIPFPPCYGSMFSFLHA
jgi:hypothetical protein